MNTKPAKTTSNESESIDWLEVVRDKVDKLRFGSVVVTVHDGSVTQIESIEKTRFTPTRDTTTRIS